MISCDHCWRDIDQDEIERELLCDCCYWLCQRCIQLVGGCIMCIPPQDVVRQRQLYGDLIEKFNAFWPFPYR